MPQITNNSELNFYLREVMKKVLIKIENDVMKVLQEYIQFDVYDVAQNESSRQWYSGGNQIPTYEFRDIAFKFDDMNITANKISTKLFYDWASLTLGTTGVGGTYIHTQDGDFRKIMAEAFNVSDYVKGDFNERLREPYWDDFIGFLFGNSNRIDQMFNKYISEEFLKMGILTKKI